ncbi:alanyl-tRNA synthetase [Archaeoglobus sulfaticallidus PM70-1]|uniref:Alanine--tRNA ligase n=1 Tax=Archaeoglobus sulfaticallidus PM70-1 TaxID=387631 RepID=N0BGZ5_9EURY|nr:alanine--tRNA ligase [Archaeoglobus sulfaticallidus]AGK61537.1 alanyl-tRNA synthetase [Archaeoglobus sulfaticallidus PM70-1]
MSLEKEYLDIAFLNDNGFIRKKCPKCGKYFWTIDEKREVCGDPPCGTYTFINRPVFKKKFNLSDMREYYLSFFEKRDHERIERYPVIARWRDDIYLTIASIADFQPFVTSGVVPPPANPLTISQPCIRMDDLDSVGRTGRHLTLFEMMAHHAFNNPEQEIYWKSETVEYCTELLEELGVNREDIIYKEEPWAGGGNAGPCLEGIVGGLEVATLVFMNLETHPDGDIEIKGEKYRKMPNYIVDTGYGLERFTWASQGTPTVYDAIFPEVLEMIVSNSNVRHFTDDEEVARIVGESSKVAGVLGTLRGEALIQLRKSVAEKIGIDVEKLEKIVKPLENVYALADHTRAILFMLGDGLVPSNAGAGYLGRLMIRRSLRIAEELEFELSLFDLVEMHRKILREFSFPTPLETIQEILELEMDRYSVTISKGIGLVERTIARKKKIEKEDLIEFYDSNGVPPELAVRIAKEKGVEVEMPEDFYAELAERHSRAEKKKESELKLDYPQTEKLYYNSKLLEFESEVIGVEGDYVILDRTAFYPESGGQDNDTGVILTEKGELKVVDVIDQNGIILHKVEGNFRPEPGMKVKGIIDRDRRFRHMRHHSATHLILYSAKKVLGKHVWQAGARKEWDKARLDITHYKRPTDEEIAEIERIANQEVMANKPVTWTFMDRIEAEKEYGFELYQGGVPPGREIRVVRVGDDVQACGGTHCDTTGEIGLIKIMKIESIQDGVIRIEYSAGEAALDFIAKEEEYLREAGSILRVEPSMLPKTVKRFFDEWKEQKKEIERLTSEIAKLKAQLLLEKAEEYDSIPVIAEIFEDMDHQEMVKLGFALAEKGAVGCLISKKDKVKVITFSGKDDINAVDLIREIGKYIKGGGGGKRNLAQGAGQIAPSRDDLVKYIFTFLGRLSR